MRCGKHTITLPVSGMGKCRIHINISCNYFSSQLVGPSVLARSTQRSAEE